MAVVTKRVRGEREFWEARVTIKGHPPLSKTFDKNKKREATKWAQEQEVKMTLPSFDVVHSHPVTRLVLAGPRASVPRIAWG